MKIIYVLIKTVHGKLKIVSSKLRTFEEVEDIHEVYGQYDIVTKIVLESQSEIKKFIQNKLLIVEGIESTETLMAFDEEN
ncbi:Lrp/AsnC ligand binding domain-containing protein [archaeon]|nr:Lrp/AsnC ligand binding domain-containing protein [archaeon]MBL7056699.1 Lrp/AsnC ligand binding domain-containing protein [Candidatus Woesearchaeota archaeon]